MGKFSNRWGAKKMKPKILELRQKFENFVAKGMLEEGFIVNSFSFSIPKEIEKFFEIVIDDIYVFNNFLEVWISSRRQAIFTISYRNYFSSEKSRVEFHKYEDDFEDQDPTKFPVIYLVFGVHFENDNLSPNSLEAIEKYKHFLMSSIKTTYMFLCIFLLNILISILIIMGTFCDKNKKSGNEKISELKRIFEDLALEKPLEIGLIINKFSFTISKELEQFLESLRKYTYRFFMSLNIPIGEKEAAYFLIFYDFSKENLEVESYTKLLTTTDFGYKMIPSLVPAVSISYFFHSEPPNLGEIENYTEIAKHDFDDYGMVSKLDLLFVQNIELDFVYYGKVL